MSHEPCPRSPPIIIFAFTAGCFCSPSPFFCHISLWFSSFRWNFRRSFSFSDVALSRCSIFQFQRCACCQLLFSLRLLRHWLSLIDTTWLVWSFSWYCFHYWYCCSWYFHIAIEAIYIDNIFIFRFHCSLDRLNSISQLPQANRHAFVSDRFSFL